MSVMLWTSCASYPFARSHERSHMPTTNGRALPTCARAYTVGPQKYMRIGPGGGGSSCLVRVSVSESRIDPPQRLLPRQRGDHRPQLRAALAARKREAQRLQVPADRLELAHDLLGVERPVRALDELAEARERRRRPGRQRG